MKMAVALGPEKDECCEKKIHKILTIAKDLALMTKEIFIFIKLCVSKTKQK